MKFRSPSFYGEFKCIASACTDTCCAGWVVEIDEESLERYRSLSGPFGEELRREIQEDEEGASFRLLAGDRCAMLNEKNLCRMILAEGEDVLCDICREHPRFYNWFGDYTEVGLGLCCEEACRLVFSSKKPLDFVLTETPEKVCDSDAADCQDPETAGPESFEGFCRTDLQGQDVEEDPGETAEGVACIEMTEMPSCQISWEEEDPLIDPLLAAREIAYQIAQDRSRPVMTRIHALLQYAELLELPLSDEDPEEISETARAFFRIWKEEEFPANPEAEGLPDTEELLSFCQNLEALSEEWPRRLQGLRKQLPDLQKAIPEYRQKYPEEEIADEHLLVYFIYRYFMNALTEVTILPQMRFAEAAIRIIGLMNVETWQQKGDFTLWDRICNVKQFSKEIEYCPENMESLPAFLLGEES